MEEPANSGLNESGKPGTADQDFEEFEIAEAELIDRYVRNELSAGERQLVENGLRRSPRLVERLHFARLLSEASSSAPAFVSPAVETETVADHVRAEPVKIPWWRNFFYGSLVSQPAFRLAVAVCVIFVLIGGVALIVGWMNLRDESNRLARERASMEQQKVELGKRLAAQQLSSEQLTAEVQKERQQRVAAEKTIADLKLRQKPSDQRNPLPTYSFASILLFPNGARDGGGNVVPVSPATSQIRLDLSLETDEYRRYRVAIQNSGGKVIVQQSVRVRHRPGPLLSIRVPAHRFPPGDYQIHVSGFASSGVLDPVEDYVFRVTEKKE